MDLMNCKRTLRVRVLSKSIGCNFDMISYDNGKIDEICTRCNTLIVIINGDYYVPSDLAPMKGDK
jgi:hypothetical protein